MSLFTQLQEPLDGALSCARRIAELAASALDRPDQFGDELRRLRRDLPHLAGKVAAALGCHDQLAGDLKHELDCVQEDVSELSEWLDGASAELRRLFAAVGPDGATAVRYGSACEQAHRECERRRQAVLASCNRAYLVAGKVCTAADKQAEEALSARKKAADQELRLLTTDDQESDNQKEQRSEQLGRCQEVVRLFKDDLFGAFRDGNRAQREGKPYDLEPFVPSLTASFRRALSALNSCSLFDRLGELDVDSLDLKKALSDHNLPVPSEKLGRLALRRADELLRGVLAGTERAEDLVRVAADTERHWVGRCLVLLMSLLASASPVPRIDAAQTAVGQTPKEEPKAGTSASNPELRGELVAHTERPSPFTIPEPTFKFAEGPPAEPRPSRSMTVGGLIQNLTTFAHFYEQATAAIESAEPVLKPSHIGNRDVNADVMQRDFRATLAIDRVRAYILANYGTDLTIGTARRLLGDLIRLCALTASAAEELPLEAAMDRLERVEAAKRERSEEMPPVQTDVAPVFALLKVFTNGLVDDRIRRAAGILTDGNLTADEKLTRIDELMRFPPTASAEKLGELVGVTKQAVMKGDWWKQHRRGEKDNEVGRRQTGYKKRAKETESPREPDIDDGR
jgi:hypothetical protein